MFETLEKENEDLNLKILELIKHFNILKMNCLN